MTGTLAQKLSIVGIDKPVSRFTLGTAFYQTQTHDQWEDRLDGYVAAGGTVIDSARGYGTSEQVLGGWLATRDVREKLILITKCGLTADGVLPQTNYPQMVRRELALSLETLRTSYIDIYMLHRDNPRMSVVEILEPLNRAVKTGQVRVLGASNWEYARLSEANAYAATHGLQGFGVVSNNLSLALPARPFYPGLVSTDSVGEAWHRETGVPLIPWSSQARGFFTGRFVHDPGDAEDSFSKQMVACYATEGNLERLNRAQKLGREKGYTAVEVALAWLLHKPFPMVPIVGPHTSEELASCIKATTLDLTDGECDWLNLRDGQ